MTRIVVGVDGSPHSRHALVRGMQEANLRGGTVDAVYVYPPPHRPLSDALIGLRLGTPTAEGLSASGPAGDSQNRDRNTQRDATRGLEQFIEEATAGVVGPAPKAVATPSEHPAEALIEQSRAADLLVIGTRGHGGFKGMLLGSVAHQCIQHSQCPVLILPPTETDG